MPIALDSEKLCTTGGFILIASSGFVEHQKLGEITTSHFDKTFGINARGLLFTVQKALPLIRDGGSIILISSILAFKGLPAYSTYSAWDEAQASRRYVPRFCSSGRPPFPIQSARSAPRISLIRCGT